MVDIVIYKDNDKEWKSFKDRGYTCRCKSGYYENASTWCEEKWGKIQWLPLDKFGYNHKLNTVYGESYL